MVKDTETSMNWWERYMPWGLSVALHVGLALLLATALFRPAPRKSRDDTVAKYSSRSAPPIPPKIKPRPMRTKIISKNTSAKGESAPDSAGMKPRWADGAETAPESSRDEKDEIWQKLEEARAFPSDLPVQDSAPVPRSATFFGAKSRADDVVYLIDFSSSLKGSFGKIQEEMLRSIGRLGEEQRFYIILFAGGRPLAGPGRGLARVTRQTKTAAAKFLSRVEPSGRTEPIAAIARAFGVLRRGGGRSKLICLLTDGAFPDNARVMRTIKKLNSRETVRINTYLYGNRSAAAGILHRIARETGGKFVRVERDRR
ncbi:MAG: vWA domain-containing protein [Candidatus Brocadiia bacterium]